MVTEIYEFQGEHRFLSNFFISPVTWGDYLIPSQQWSCVEVPYQLAKTLSLEKRMMAMALISRTPINKQPGVAKKLGNSLFSLRADWDSVKNNIMLKLLLSKFSNPELKQALLNTGDATLIEGNTWGDTYWGCCDGVGENHLGRLLMQVRATLKG